MRAKKGATTTVLADGTLQPTRGFQNTTKTNVIGSAEGSSADSCDWFAMLSGWMEIFPVDAGNAGKGPGASA